jgi:GxxExxY protein
MAMQETALTGAVIGAAIEVHRMLGPGLLESANEECLAHEFSLRQIPYERQKPAPVIYKAVKLEAGYRTDFVVGRELIVELKAVDALGPVHDAILLTYLRMTGCPIGLLINFNVVVLRDGIRRLRL